MIRSLRLVHRLVFTLLALGLPILLAAVLAARHRWPVTAYWPPRLPGDVPGATAAGLPAAASAVALVPAVAPATAMPVTAIQAADPGARAIAAAAPATTAAAGPVAGEGGR